MALEGLLRDRKLYRLVGLAGVSKHESKRARFWGGVFVGVMVLVSIAMLVGWQSDVDHQISELNKWYLNDVIWVFFVIAYTVPAFLVKDRRRYFRENWLYPIIIMGGLPFLCRMNAVTHYLEALRPVLALLILTPSLHIIVRYFMDGQLSTTLLGALLIIVIFGVLVAGVDPAVKSAWEGIWWALATVSTVGYGDVVPVSFFGRLLGAGLIVMGLGIFVVITANFLALSLRKEKQAFQQEDHQINELLNEVETLKENQNEILQLLKTLKHEQDKHEE